MPLHFRFVDNQARQTLLLLHGFMGRLDDWNFLLEHADLPVNLLLIDLPGHGASVPWPENGFTFAHFFEELNTLLQNTAWQQVHLLGYSLGGRLALQWALRHPQAVLSLILESANPGIDDPVQKELRLQHDRALSTHLQQNDFTLFLNEWYRQPLFGKLSKRANFASFLQYRQRNNVQQLALALSGFSVGRQPSLWEALPEIQFPVLLICGALDQKYRRICQAMQKRNPRFEQRIAPQCAHTVHYENPQWFAQTVAAFLQKVR